MKTQSESNDSIYNRIYRRIQWDIRVDNSDILFKVVGGHVVLTGSFDEPYRHSAAIEIIKSTEGVETIDDLSKVVAGYYRTDAELKLLITGQLESLQLAQDEWIRIEVANGVATLEGVVFRPRLKSFAANDCWGHSGIKDCVNLIEVRSFPPPAMNLRLQVAVEYVSRIRTAVFPPSQRAPFDIGC